MAFDYVCPQPSALTTIPRGCKENIGEIRHIAIGRKGLIAFDDATEDITVKAIWTTRLAATDDTKVVVIPNLINFVSNEPTFITEGAEESIGGVESVIGVNNVEFTGMLKGLKGSVLKAARALNTESLEFIIINEFGKIIGKDVSSALDGSIIGGFPILEDTFGIGNNGANGKAATDKTPIRLACEDVYWRDDMVISTPAAGFNPLIDLLPAFES